MKTPLTEETYAQRDGESALEHTLRKRAVMEGLETHLRSIVENSFFGISTGYEHVDPKCVKEARKFLSKTQAAVDTAYFIAVYAILIKHAGARPSDRDNFVFSLSTPDSLVEEWRFQGSLGFGGKYWRTRNCVTAFPEDYTQEREQIIQTTNAALARLQDIE